MVRSLAEVRCADGAAVLAVQRKSVLRRRADCIRVVAFAAGQDFHRVLNVVLVVKILLIRGNRPSRVSKESAFICVFMLLGEGRLALLSERLIGQSYDFELFSHGNLRATKAPCALPSGVGGLWLPAAACITLIIGLLLVDLLLLLAVQSAQVFLGLLENDR